MPFSGPAAGNALIFTLLPPIKAKASWSRLSWRAALNYKPNDDILLYGAVTRGFRAGDYNLGEFLNPSARSFYNPETALNFETGIKADWMDGRLRTNITTFYTQYKGLQVSAIRKVPGSPLPVLSVINASGADVYGVEAEITALPTDHLTILASLGYLHTKFGSYKNCRTGIDCTGNPLPFSPKWTLSASAIYETPVTQNFIGSLRLDYSYTAERYSTSLADPATLAPGYINLNTRVAIKTENVKWEIGIYARNLTNEKYIESFVDIASTFGFNRVLVKGERRFGVELITHW